jgi:hypothetical protein
MKYVSAEINKRKIRIGVHLLVFLCCSIRAKYNIDSSLVLYLLRVARSSLVFHNVSAF